VENGSFFFFFFLFSVKLYEREMAMWAGLTFFVGLLASWQYLFSYESFWASGLPGRRPTVTVFLSLEVGAMGNGFREKRNR
jgi:hypothetical protein